MIRSLTREEVLSRIDELLEARYGSASLHNKPDPLDELVFILLSLQTQANGFTATYGRLKRTFRTWDSVLRAPTNTLVRLLKPGGLARQKAVRLKAILRKIATDTQENGAPTRIRRSARSGGRLSLAFLRRLPDHGAEEYLMGLPGIGPKTARCVLMYSLGRDAFPVDTNVYRILTRLGVVPLIPWKLAHDPYQAAVPKEMRKRLHINLVHHGREVCRPQPRCTQCVLISFCATGRDLHKRLQRTKPVAVDLFCGAGSLSAGFEAAGWGIALAADTDRNAAQTYRFNHPGTPVLETDVARLSAKDISVTTGLKPGQIDAVIGGPPCQGYSAAGKRLPEEPRNFLYRSFGTLARNLRARIVVMENVPGVSQVNGTRFVGRIVAHFRRLGFVTDAFLLNAVQFGVPQRRKRLIFFGVHPNAGLPLVAPSEEFASPEDRKSLLPKPPTVRDALRGLPRIRACGGAEIIHRDGISIFNHWAMRHSGGVVAKMKGIKRGSGPISYKRLRWGYVGTIIAGHRALPVHPSVPRSITVREAARIQTIPDTYRFLGRRWLQPLQVADAVPYRLAVALGRHALKYRRARRPKASSTSPRGGSANGARGFGGQAAD